MNNSNRLRTIQQASYELNIPKPTLRFWEREFDGILVPARSEGGQRRYTESNIHVISKIKELREKGMSLVEIKDYFGNGSECANNSSTANGIDILASRIAEAVKSEVYMFFKNGVR